MTQQTLLDEANQEIRPTLERCGAALESVTPVEQKRGSGIESVLLLILTVVWTQFGSEFAKEAVKDVYQAVKRWVAKRVAKGQRLEWELRLKTNRALGGSEMELTYVLKGEDPLDEGFVRALCFPDDLPASRRKGRKASRYVYQRNRWRELG